MKLLHLVCLVAVALSGVHAQDAGPATGGRNSANPNSPPRTESAGGADAGPMAGTPARAGPRPDAGPPMSGGDLSTNPNTRTTAPPTLPPTLPPTTTPTAPTMTTAAPTPSLTTKPPATITEKPPATITEKPPATITSKPPPASTTSKPPMSQSPSAAPSTTKANETEVAVSRSGLHDTHVLDFSDIRGEKSSDVVGEVSADFDEDSLRVAKDKKKEAAAPATGIDTTDETPAPKAEAQAATPSPVSKKTISNSNGMSSAQRTAPVSMASVVVATVAAAMVSVMV